MHELAIAENILDIIHSAVPPQHRAAVRTVRVKVGESSGIMPEALTFSFEALIQETPLSLATLAIDRVPFSIQCRKCGQQCSDPAGIARCPFCGSSMVDILSGNELEVTELELNEEEVEA